MGENVTPDLGWYWHCSKCLPAAPTYAWPSVYPSISPYPTITPITSITPYASSTPDLTSTPVNCYNNPELCVTPSPSIIPTVNMDFYAVNVLNIGDGSAHCNGNDEFIASEAVLLNINAEGMGNILLNSTNGVTFNSANFGINGGNVGSLFLDVIQQDWNTDYWKNYIESRFGFSGDWHGNYANYPYLYDSDVFYYTWQITTGTVEDSERMDICYGSNFIPSPTPTLTPVPTAYGASYCAGVITPDPNNPPPDPVILPVPVISPPHCDINIGGQVLNLEFLPVLGGTYTVPEFTICTRLISFGELTILKIVVNLDVISGLMAGIWLLRVMMGR